MLSTFTRNNRIHSKQQDSKQGFTLIELLMVIAVITILASITFGISRGVQNAKNRAVAKAELAAIAQGLEQFKSANGDYPWVNDEPTELLQALMGWKEFNRTTSGAPATFDSKAASSVPANGPKAFIDPTKLIVNDAEEPDKYPPDEIPTDPKVIPTGLAFIDPWGKPYVYAYKTPTNTSWNNFGYVLYSKGADGLDSPVDSNGIVNEAFRTQIDNLDNIYSGE